MTANRGIFVTFSSIALLGLIATVVPLAAGPATAQEVPFIKRPILQRALGVLLYARQNLMVWPPVIVGASQTSPVATI